MRLAIITFMLTMSGLVFFKIIEPTEVTESPEEIQMQSSGLSSGFHYIKPETQEQIDNPDNKCFGVLLDDGTESWMCVERQ